jgi:SAM-dependent methyltransferase
VRLPGRELQDRLGDWLPADHARQTIADEYIPALRRARADGPWRVLDLGCGEGGSVDLFRAQDQGVDWIGLDIHTSQEVQRRSRADARFELFDGVTIPFADDSFDVVFCKQVLEHVRYPGPLLGEVRRVLAPGGHLAGSTSQLEPYHSLSYWNYTPVGFVELAQEAGLVPVEIRPGIDSLGLIGRRLVPRGRRTERVFGRWWGETSPLNRLIDVYGRVFGLDARTVNATKLLFAGQFAFLCSSP